MTKIRNEKYPKATHVALCNSEVGRIILNLTKKKFENIVKAKCLEVMTVSKQWYKERMQWTTLYHCTQIFNIWDRWPDISKKNSQANFESY